MVRTQIQLTDAQASALKRRAAERGVSMAALIRDAIDRVLADDGDFERRKARALAAVGAHRDRDGANDVSVEHDHFLDDAYLDWPR